MDNDYSSKVQRMPSHFCHVRPQLMAKRIKYSTPYTAKLVSVIDGERKSFQTLLQAIPVLAQLGITIPRDAMPSIKRDLEEESWLSKLMSGPNRNEKSKQEELNSFTTLFEPE